MGPSFLVTPVWSRAHRPFPLLLPSPPNPNGIREASTLSSLLQLCSFTLFRSFSILLSNVIFLRHKPAQTTPLPKVNIRFAFNNQIKFKFLSKTYSFFPPILDQIPQLSLECKDPEGRNLISLFLCSIPSSETSLARSRCLISTLGRKRGTEKVRKERKQLVSPVMILFLV